MPKWVLISLLIAGLPTAGLAQARGGFGGFHNGIGIRIGPSFANGHGHDLGRNVFSAGPFWYADYPAQSAVYEPPTSSVVVVQPNAAPVIAEPKPEPLMIEWQGDKYVRLSGQREAATLDYSRRGQNAQTAGDQVRPAQPRPSDVAPVVLVYRDGRREKVSDYVIANGNLYARGDYWRDGFWTKTVQLSILDLPATLHINSQAGVNFVLPSNPNEVITRP